MPRFYGYYALFIASVMVGVLIVVALPMLGTPDYVTAPAALVAAVGTLVLCVRSYKHRRPRHTNRSFRPVVTSYFARTPVPEDIADDIAQDASRTRPTGNRRKRYPTKHPQ